MAIAQRQLTKRRTCRPIIESLGMIVRVIVGGQLREQCAVAPSAAIQVLGDPRRGNKQPRQQRIIDKTCVLTPPPGLHERDRDGIIRIGQHRHKAQNVPIHPIAMPIEDAPKSLSDTVLRLRPVVAISIEAGGVHTL